jgi:hypothetical protein
MRSMFEAYTTAFGVQILLEGIVSVHVIQK